MVVLEAKSLRKAEVPLSLIENPSPGNIQCTRLALHVNEDGCSCFVYIASGCHLYKLQVMMDDWFVSEGKDSLLIPEQTPVMDSSMLNRCPHRSEVQSIALAETDSSGYMVLGSVDSYGHLIVSKLDTSGKDVDRLTYSVLPQDCGVGEAVARSFSKSIDVYDQDIHLRTLLAYFDNSGIRHSSVLRLWYPSSLNFIQNLSPVNGGPNMLAVTEGCQLTIWDLRMKENGGCLHRICGSVGDILYAVCSSSTGNIAVAGADRTVTIYDPRRWSALSRWVHCSKYEVFCGQWRESSKVFAFRGDSNWLGFSKCSNRDVLGGWSDSGSIFVADVVAKENEISALKGLVN
ncbi:hypothetical protein KPL71_016435 [Citrus sinensis]|uniref:Uncharacterized protein n=1 Tax=Citrus sinensis TaxID=2711 RepID=A0ACB8KTF7_CITSI|nr:hypothetical protein KPL71_016435 [Citrus sinensis]